jgi:hypothetical protein
VLGSLDRLDALGRPEDAPEEVVFWELIVSSACG